MTCASNDLCLSQGKAIKRIRAVAAGLAGIVHGVFYLIPMVAEVIGDATWPNLGWSLPLVSAFVAGAWAWHSAFGCRLVGICTLLTSPLALFTMLLGPALIFEAPPRNLMIMVPIVVAALGILTLQAGSNSLDRMVTTGRHLRRGT